MALISCKSCHKQISSHAKVCIHCNTKIRNLRKSNCITCGENIGYSQIICPNCGHSKQNEDDSTDWTVRGIPLTKLIPKILPIVGTILCIYYLVSAISAWNELFGS